MHKSGQSVSSNMAECPCRTLGWNLRRTVNHPPSSVSKPQNSIRTLSLGSSESTATTNQASIVVIINTILLPIPPRWVLMYTPLFCGSHPTSARTSLFYSLRFPLHFILALSPLPRNNDASQLRSYREGVTHCYSWLRRLRYGQARHISGFEDRF